MINTLLNFFGLVKRKEYDEAINDLISMRHTLDEIKRTVRKKNETSDKLVQKLQKANEELTNENLSLKVIQTESFTLAADNKHQDKLIKRLQQKERALLRKQGKFKEKIKALEETNQKLQRTVDYQASYQIILHNYIDRIKFGFPFAYMESLKPRQIVEVTPKNLKSGKYDHLLEKCNSN